MISKQLAKFGIIPVHHGWIMSPLIPAVWLLGNALLNCDKEHLPIQAWLEPTHTENTENQALATSV